MQTSSTMHSFEVSNGRTGGKGESFTVLDGNAGTSRTGFSGGNGAGAAGKGDSFSPSDGDADASCTVFSGGSVGRESGNGASTAGVSAAGASARATAGSVVSGLGATDSPGEPGAAANNVSRGEDSALTEAAGAPALMTAGSVESGSDVAAWPRESIAVAGDASRGRISALKEMTLRVASGSVIGVAAFSMAGESKPNRGVPEPTRATVPHNATNVTSCCGLIIPLLSTLGLRVRLLRARRPLGTMTSAIVGSASLHATKKATGHFYPKLLPKYNVFQGDQLVVWGHAD